MKCVYFIEKYFNKFDLLINCLVYIKKYKFKFTLSITLSLITMFFSNIQPLLFGKIIDSISNYDNKQLFRNVVIISVLFITNIILILIKNYTLVKLTQNIELDVSQELFGSILDLDINEFNKIQHGKYLNMLSNDVRAFSNIFTEKFTIIIDIISIIIVGIILLRIDWKLTLKNISLEIEENKITALVGKSGEGKTTLLNILSGLYDNYSGDIYIGNVNIKNISKNYLREKVCYVLQESFLFSLSIKDNFKILNNKISDLEIVEICKTVNIHNFIMSLPERYNTQIGFNGIQLSVGQKQRLSIGRALSKNADIFLFDEITSALDSQNEESLMNLIKDLSKQKTILIISHKESTIKYADKIITLESGEILIKD